MLEALWVIKLKAVNKTVAMQPGTCQQNEQFCAVAVGQVEKAKKKSKMKFVSQWRLCLNSMTIERQLSQTWIASLFPCIRAGISKETLQKERRDQMLTFQRLIPGRNHIDAVFNSDAIEHLYNCRNDLEQKARFNSRVQMQSTIDGCCRSHSVEWDEIFVIIGTILFLPCPVAQHAGQFNPEAVRLTRSECHELIGLLSDERSFVSATLCL